MRHFVIQKSRKIKFHLVSAAVKHCLDLVRSSTPNDLITSGRFKLCSHLALNTSLHASRVASSDWISSPPLHEQTNMCITSFCSDQMHGCFRQPGSSHRLPCAFVFEESESRTKQFCDYQLQTRSFPTCVGPPQLVLCLSFNVLFCFLL